MSPEDIPSKSDSTQGSLTRRNAMIAGAALAGGTALAGTAPVVTAETVDTRPGGAMDIFLEIDGIEGESRTPGHEGEIEVLSWSWGMSQSGTTHRGRGGGAGKVSVQDLTIAKQVDKSTPDLYRHCATGRHAPSGTMTIRAPGGDEVIDFLVIDFENIIVTDIQTGGLAGDVPTESVSLNFAQFTMEYTPQDIDGSPLESVSFGWDIQRNEER